jgi:hypothetical protein
MKVMSRCVPSCWCLCSLTVITRGFDFGCGLNAITNTVVETTAAVGTVDM